MELIKSRVCFKCGIVEGTLVLRRDIFKPVVVIPHHISYIPEIIVDCCRSCHKKIHHKVKINNLCPLTKEERRKLSNNSSHKRDRRKNKQLLVSTNYALDKNIVFSERVWVRFTTGTLTYTSYFAANHGKKLKVIDI